MLESSLNQKASCWSCCGNVVITSLEVDDADDDDVNDDDDDDDDDDEDDKDDNADDGDNKDTDDITTSSWSLPPDVPSWRVSSESYKGRLSAQISQTDNRLRIPLALC